MFCGRPLTFFALSFLLASSAALSTPTQGNNTMGRKAFIGACAGTMALVSVPLMASAGAGADADGKLGPIVALQGKIQKILRPASRFPGLRTPHAWQENWEIASDAATFVNSLGPGLSALNDSPAAGGFVYELDVAEASGGKGKCQVSAFTR